jgi:uncharacterized integral membrane protein
MSEQKVPSVGDWMVTLLIMSIPVVNFIVLLIWAFSSNTDPIKANFSKAALLWLLIIMVLYMLFFGALIGAFLGAMN